MRRTSSSELIPTSVVTGEMSASLSGIDTSESPVSGNFRNGLLPYLLYMVFAALMIGGIVYFMSSSFYPKARSNSMANAQADLTTSSEKLAAFLDKAETTAAATAATLEYMLSQNASLEDLHRYLVCQTNVYQAGIEPSYIAFYGFFRGKYIDSGDWTPPPDYAPRSRPWYVNAKRMNGAIAISMPYTDADTGSIIISVSKLLKDKDSVFVIDVVLDQIRHCAAALRADGIIYSMVTAPNGFIVSHNIPREIGLNYLNDSLLNDPLGMRDIISRINRENGAPFSAVISKQQCLVFSNRIRDAWNATVVVSEDKLFAGVKSILFHEYLAAILAFALVGTIITVYYLKRNRPVSSISTPHRQQTQSEITRNALDTLSAEYESVFYINLSTEETLSLRVSSSMERFWGADGQHCCMYSTAFAKYVQEAVFLDDRKEMRVFGDIDNLREMLNRQHTITKTYRSTDNGQTEYFEAKFVKTGNQGGVPHLVLGIANRDNAVRKTLEQQKQLEDAKAHAETANNAKSAFLYSISQEIRTPTDAILGYCDLALKNPDDNAKVDDCLQKVKIAGTHLMELINDVHDMAQIESGKLNINITPVDIRTLLDKITTLVATMADKAQIKFSSIIDGPRNQTVFLDEPHISRILVNLLSNAIQYTKPGGEVTFTTRQLPDAPDNHVRYQFIVADTGIGMSRDLINRIYESFVQTPNHPPSAIQDTGLGMAIAQKLVDRLRGSMKISSAPGIGTTVTCTLDFPRQPPGAPFNSVSDAAVTPSLKGTHLLLVEDNQMSREVAVGILRGAGAEVTIAEDGAVGVEIVKTSPAGTFSAVLMDIQMPLMDGYQATRIIRSLPDKNIARIPIIALTADALKEDRQKALDAGMNDHIGKPIDVDKLLCLLRNFTLPAGDADDATGKSR